MEIYMTFFLFLLLWITPTVVFAEPEMMRRECGELIPLDSITVITGNTEAGKKLTDAIRQFGVKMDILTPSDAMASDGLQWKQKLTSHTVIVLGGIHTNQAMLPLYAEYLSFGDADFPGEGGYVIRTITRPFGPGTATIALEASTPEGEANAVERFTAMLSESEGRRFPQTLEAHLSDYWSNKVKRDQSGIRYALTGDPKQAEEGIRQLLNSMDPETGWLNYGDYGIERYVRDYSLLQDALGIHQDDWQRLDQGLLMTAIQSSKQWWRSKDGHRIGGRHQTMGTSCFTAAVHLLLRRGNPNEEAKALLDQWWMESHDYWKGVCSTFHDDLDGIPSYYSPEPALDWALIMGFDEYIKRQLPLAILRAYAVIDNMGYYAGTGTYEECRPGDLFKTVPWGWLLKAANYFHPGQGYDWLLQNIPNTEINTWAVTRNIAGARAFSNASEPTVPVRFLGIQTVPMGPYRYAQLPHSSDEVRYKGLLHLPASLERCFEKLCFRDSFERKGQYLVLEGYQTSWSDNLPPMDANSIIRYTDLGHIWLHSNSEKAGNLFRSAVFCTDGINDDLQSAGCELQTLYNGSNVGMMASHFPDYVACDWTRNIIWQRGKYFVIIDLMRQNREGKFGLICSFRTPQQAWLQRDGMIAREGVAEMHILNADQVQLSLEDEHELEGAAIPTFLRETQFLDGHIGTIKAFRNLIYASDPDHPGELEVRFVGEIGMMVKGIIRGDEELALLAVSSRNDGIKIGSFGTDAQVLYVGLSGWVQAGGTGMKLNDRSYDGSEGKTDLQIRKALESLWAATNPVIRSDINVGSEEQLKKAWQFGGFSNLPAPAVAPILTSEPEPQGLLGSLLDGVVTRGPTVRWPSGASEIKLNVDLRESQIIQQIDFQTGQIGSYNTIPDPTSYPKPCVVRAEFSNDNLNQDVRRRELVFTSDCTFEGIHKGSVFPILRWTCRNISEKARYVRLIFNQRDWQNGLGMNELSVRAQGHNSARIIGHVLRDVDGDGEKDILAWSDQSELVAVSFGGMLLWKRQFPGYITAVECYHDLHHEGPRMLVTTREARLYCLG